MKAITFSIFLLSCIRDYAQTREDSVLFQTGVTKTSDTITFPKEMAVEIFKINSNKTFRIDRTRNVWVRCPNKNGKIKIKRAQLIIIHDHDMTFRPFNKNFNEITYLDTDILYIGFTSVGRIVVASVSNIVIIGAVVVITFVFVIAEIFSGSHGRVPRGPDLSFIPLVPFRKNIDFYQTSNGSRKWGIRIVEIKEAGNAEYFRR